MCGIAGQIALSDDVRVDTTLVPRTAALLAHRGPDGWGYVVDPPQQVLLLNTRLAIVDVAGGRQPIANEDGQIWVTLNGECYGFERQREWLAGRGHRFRTKTDTEILVHLYEELGERFVEELRGEYAFALHDRRRGVCLLVRDRFGVKPLVFAEHRGRLLFASEIKALFADPSLERTLDREHIFHALGGALLPQRTFFRGVQQVEAGTMVRVHVGRSWQRSRYWELPFQRSRGISARPDAEANGSPRRDAEAILEFGQKLQEATRLRLHGDVEVGAYLSGGVDSAAVLQAIGDSGASVRSFTIGFESGPFDESAGAASVARHFRATHQVLRIGPHALSEPFTASQWHSETPVMNAHGAAKFLLSRLAGSHVKVVLTGEGADELLAGYPQFRHQQLLDVCHRNPRDQEARRALHRFTASSSVFTGTAPIRRYPSYDRVVDRFGAYPYALTRVFAYQRPMRWLLSSDFQRLTKGLDTLTALDEAMGPRAFEGLDPISASQALLFRTELPGYILVNLGDRQEMAHGVEGRTPFLDHELVELACALPMRLKLAPHRDKHVLRAFVERAMPDAGARPKHIFLAPSSQALGLEDRDGPLAAWLEPQMIRETNVFSPLALSLLRQILRRAAHGTRHRAMAEAVLVFAVSLTALESLFCRGFEAACSRYAPDPASFEPAGNVVDAGAGVAG
jgi:asparagine synthase (glutamine-hydrolysing)